MLGVHAVRDLRFQVNAAVAFVKLFWLKSWLPPAT